MANNAATVPTGTPIEKVLADAATAEAKAKAEATAAGTPEPTTPVEGTPTPKTTKGKATAKPKTAAKPKAKPVKKEDKLSERFTGAIRSAYRKLHSKDKMSERSGRYIYDAVEKKLGDSKFLGGTALTTEELAALKGWSKDRIYRTARRAGETV